MAVAVVRPDTLYAWKGLSLLIVNTRGECGPDQPLSGYYFREARFLRTLQLQINGQAPWRCEAASASPDWLALNFVYPEIGQPGGGGTGQAGDEEATDAHGIAERSLDVRLSSHVGIAELIAVLAIANRARRRLKCEVAWALGGDFADIQEAQSGNREQQAAVDTVAHDSYVEFTYRHPELPFRTHIHHGSRWSWRDERLVAQLVLEPQQADELMIRLVPLTGREDLTPIGVAERESALRRWQEHFARVVAPRNPVFERVLSSNVRDLASFPLLDGPPDEWLAMQAGVPLYPAFFGRDAITAGWQAGCVDGGESLAAALIKLGRLQSDRFDDWRDEQPGRIPYQVRRGPLALLNLNPYSAYYADYASPLMFVISLANLWAWTGDRRHLEQHWDTARRILDWARDYGDFDRDGYLEYQTRSTKGTKNQGWKDSGDGIIYEDGRPVPAPIATCELQGYWYIAQVYGSRVAVRQMRQRGGALINVASALADRAIPVQANYCAAKHAIKAFTDGLRMELEEEGVPISVTLVKPASIDTPLFEKARTYLGVEPQPVPPVYAPDVVSEVILHAARHPLRELIAGAAGAKLSAARLAPRLADLYMKRWTFDSQGTSTPVTGRPNNLYEPVADDGGERGRNWSGHTRSSSLYTKAMLHPAATAAVMMGVVAGLALTRASGRAAPIATKHLASAQ